MKWETIASYTVPPGEHLPVEEVLRRMGMPTFRIELGSNQGKARVRP